MRKYKYNITKLSQSLMNCLNDREKDILKRRYALEGGKRETLESIGKSYGITRERVRQIERASLRKIKKLIDYRNILQGLVKDIDFILEKYGGVIAHDHLKDELIKRSVKEKGEKKDYTALKNKASFILEEFVSDLFHFRESGEYHHDLWSKNPKFAKNVKDAIGKIEEFLLKVKKPVSHKIIAKRIGEPVDSVYSYLHLSRKISKNPFGAWGLSEWNSITPKRMSDRIYLVLKKYNEPLHYKDIAFYIERHYNRKTHPPTVHNELIADPRFVLVGRGIYALKEWGYISGTVKDIVHHVLKSDKRPLTRDEIIEKVKKQRIVARATILLAINSSNKIKKIGKDRYQLINHTRPKCK